MIIEGKLSVRLSEFAWKRSSIFLRSRQRLSHLRDIQRSDQLTSPRLSVISVADSVLGRPSRREMEVRASSCVRYAVGVFPLFATHASRRRGKRVTREEWANGCEAGHSRVVRFHAFTPGGEGGGSTVYWFCHRVPRPCRSPRLGRLVSGQKGGRQSRTVVVDVDDDQSNRLDRVVLDRCSPRAGRGQRGVSEGYESARGSSANGWSLLSLAHVRRSSTRVNVSGIQLSLGKALLWRAALIDAPMNCQRTIIDDGSTLSNRQCWWNDVRDAHSR